MYVYIAKTIIINQEHSHKLTWLFCECRMKIFTFNKLQGSNILLQIVSL